MARHDIRTNESNNFSNAFDVPTPPATAGIRLSDDEMEAYKNIVAGKANSDWLDAHLILAAECAKVTVMLSKLREEAKHEDPVVIGAQGRQLANPKFRVIEKLNGQQLRLYQIMGLSAGRSKKSVTRRAAVKQKEARELASSSKGKVSLLAQPD